ncbi:MAG: hypothetical protein IJP96_02130 [Synergistaceae bacterium]|nr:hypothetical protein [Synergistaceae bacterium]MBQ6738192.1 hypothetical protein [Synergistaceae bacterium]MBR0074537.1 hypothetical protein [Synergistaceae bacterium]MBR0080981.1 hypothetical protein [Synergistaceae bacterium]MBR0233192.1 hypothetical protein [Synergistaceae bacterium]
MFYVENPLPGQAGIIFENMEEQRKYFDSLYGSITDETFVEPEDYYCIPKSKYHEYEQNILS